MAKLKYAKRSKQANKSRISGEFENESKFSGEIPNFVEHGRILIVLDTVEDCNFVPTNFGPAKLAVFDGWIEKRGALDQRSFLEFPLLGFGRLQSDRRSS